MGTQSPNPGSLTVLGFIAQPQRHMFMKPIHEAEHDARSSASLRLRTPLPVAAQLAYI
jgi:hypothetical protein